MTAQTPLHEGADLRLEVHTLRSVHIECMPLTCTIDPTSHPDEVPDTALDVAALDSLPEPLRAAALQLGHGGGQVCALTHCGRAVGWMEVDPDGGSLFWQDTVLVEIDGRVEAVCADCAPQRIYTPRP